MEISTILQREEDIWSAPCRYERPTEEKVSIKHREHQLQLDLILIEIELDE